MTELPQPDVMLPHGKYEILTRKEMVSFYTADTVRQLIAQAREDALEEAIILNWTEIMREGALVTWGDAETLGDRVIAILDKLKEQVK
jgi:hypothetical protein